MAEGDSVPTCYGCILHAVIVKHIQENATENKIEEKERDNKKK